MRSQKNSLNIIKIALVYDRVNKWGGAERVLLVLHELFPDAPLYTAVYHREKASWAKVFPKVIPTFLNKISFLRDKHELLGAFTPIAFESFDFSDYDVVVSVTSEAAKGIITKTSTLHICYCLTPTRYLWSHYDFYFENPASMFRRIPLFKQVSKPIISYLRVWDKIAAQRPDVMVGISKAVCGRIKKYYARDSELIYPPVDIEKFQIPNSKPPLKKRKYFLYVSRLIPYKRPDLVVEAFNQIGFPLVVVGTGSEEQKLKSVAKKNISFVGHLTDDKLARYYQEAKALIFPGEEDFGMVMVEAQAAGTPVIAYKKGGATDIVEDGKTGIFFEEQKIESLIRAIKKIEGFRFSERSLIRNSKKFSTHRFKKEFLELLDKYKNS